jgi:hypothetical protein
LCAEIQFFGQSAAGQGQQLLVTPNFFGPYAGYQATTTYYSNFMGNNALVIVARQLLNFSNFFVVRMLVMV